MIKVRYSLYAILISTSCIAAEQELADKDKLPPLPTEVVQHAQEDVAKLTPSEIKDSRRLYENLRKAENSHLFNLKPTVSTVSLSLDPSDPVPSIRTVKGANTFVTFIDSMGKPWPYELVSYGSDAYKDGPSGEKKRHIAEIKVEQDFVPSTFSVALEGTDKIYNFMLKPSEDGEFDLSKTFIVPGQSPESKKNWQSHVELSNKSSALVKLPKLTNELNLFLDNVPPSDAETIPVMDVVDVQAWKYKGRMIVRTNKRLNWPAASPLYGMDDYRVYELPHASPILTFIENGHMVSAHIPDDAIADLPRLER